MPPVVIGAAIAGTAAVAGGAIAASGAKKAAQTQAEAQQAQIQAQQEAAAKEEQARREAVAKKEAAIAGAQFPSIVSTPEGAELKQTLQERIAGRGLIDVSAQTAPVAEQIRAGLPRTEAAISSAASARGLGRSTVPVSQIGEASKAAERDIAQRVADLELTRQQQIQDAIGRFKSLAETETAGLQRKAEFERGGEFAVAETISGNAQAVADNEFQIAETIRVKGATEAAGQLLSSQMIASGLLGLGQSAQDAAAQQSADDILEAILEERELRNQALVNK